MINNIVLLLALSSNTVYVAMRQRHLDVLHSAVMNMSNHTHPDYGKYWSRDKILDLIAPPEGNVSYVRHVLANRSYVCDQSFRDAMSCIYRGNASTSPPRAIDPEFQGLVSLVVAYNEGGMEPSQVKPRYHQRHSPVGPDPGFFGRESLLKLYNFTQSTSRSAMGESVGAAEYFGETGFNQNDIADSQTFNGQALNPVMHAIGPHQGSFVETELDLQMESQVADGADIWYWNNNNQWLYSWALRFFNSTDVPSIVSHSWGWAINKQCAQGLAGCVNPVTYVERVNIEYLKIAARGVTLTASSGDAGAPGRTNEGCSSVRPVTTIFPSSSPYVLSVGATYVVNNGTNKTLWNTPLCKEHSCTTGTGERTTYFNVTGWTAGGGFSTMVDGVAPPWQRRAVNKYLNKGLPMPSKYNPTGRVIPDISAVGHNCPTWIWDGRNGQVNAVDGTSCSSPIIAGIIAVINRHQTLRGRPRVGLVAPLLYAMYYDDPTIFNDITQGANWCTELECCPTRSDGGSDYGYMSASGYDPVTGLGTPNIGRMLEWLDRNT